MGARGRIITTVGLAGVLSGCAAIPLSVTVASYAVDGMSYATTGKSITDHGLSALMEEDCATWRLLTGEPVCVKIITDRDGRPKVIVVASAEDAAALASRTGEGVSPLPEATTELDVGTYYVVGSFAEPLNARTLAIASVDMKPMIMPAMVGEHQFYRVMVGPVTDEEATRTALTGAGLVNGWILHVHPAPADTAAPAAPPPGETTASPEASTTRGDSGAPTIPDPPAVPAEDPDVSSPAPVS